MFRHNPKELGKVKGRKHYVNRWESNKEEVEEYIKNSNDPITLITHDNELYEYLNHTNKKDWLIQPYILTDSVYRDWNPFFWSNRYSLEEKEVCRMLECADKKFLCRTLEEKFYGEEILREIQHYFHCKYDDIMGFKKIFNTSELHMKEFYEDINKDIKTTGNKIFKKFPFLEKEYRNCEESIKSISLHNTFFQLMRSSLAVKNNHIIILINKETLTKRYYFHLLNHLLLKRSIIIPESKVVFGMVDFTEDKDLLHVAEHLIATQRNYGMTYFIKQPKLDVNDLDKNSPLYSHQYFSLICANNETSSQITE